MSDNSKVNDLPGRRFPLFLEKENRRILDGFGMGQLAIEKRHMLISYELFFIFSDEDII